MPQPPSLYLETENATEPTLDETAEKTPVVARNSNADEGTSGRVLRAAAILSVLYALSRFTGLVQLTIVNSLLDKAQASAYVAAFTLPEYMYYLVAGGALSVTFIPILAQLEEGERNYEAGRFMGALLGVMSTVLALLLLVCWVFARPLTLFFNPGFARPGFEETLNLCVTMTRVMLPAQWFFYVGGLLVAVLNARGKFGATGWTGAVYNIVAVSVSVPLWWLLYFLPIHSIKPTSLGATGFAWGILVGAGVGYLWIPLQAYLALPEEERLPLTPNFDWRQPAVQTFWKNALWIMVGVSLPVMDVPIIKFFASNFKDAGSINYMNDAYRVMLAPLSIVAQAASVAAFPSLSKNIAAADYQKLADFLRSGLRRLMFLTLPLSILLMVEARPIISVMFGYGKFAKQPEAVPVTATTFALFCLGLFAWAGQALVARGFYALQDTSTPTKIGSALTVGFIILCAFMQRWNIQGLAVATSIGATSHFVCILIALGRRLNGLPYKAKLGGEQVGGVLLRTGVACLPMAFLGWLTGLLCQARLPGTKLGDLVQLVVVGIVSVSVFGVSAHVCNIPEWKWLQRKLLRR